MGAIFQAIEDEVSLFKDSENTYQLNLPVLLNISLILKQEMKRNPRDLQFIS